MTAAEVLSSARKCLNRSDLEQAAQLCKQLLQDAPQNAKAWHLLGIINAQQGQLEQAAENFQHAIDFDPSHALYDYNLGLAYKGLGKWEQAAASYRSAISKNETLIEAHNNLANLLIALKQHAEAIACFREMLRLFPDSTVGHYNLANLLQDTGNLQESQEHYQRVIELNPSFSAARENLGRALVDAGHIQQAQQVWKDWLEAEPGNAMAKHMLAAASGESIPERCDDDYIRQAFSQEFADNFDDQLARLNYQAPQLVLEAILAPVQALAGRTSAEQSQQASPSLDVLDAGCGTGLCGPLVRSFARRLVGVDLSEQMLEKARARDVYDETFTGELCTFMRADPQRFDLIVSADTLCYFGDLTEALQAAFACLKANGLLAFTVEALATSASHDYQLGCHGRYSHAEAYVRQAADDAGFSTVHMSQAVLRTERGQPVEGFVVTAAKQAQP